MNGNAKTDNFMLATATVMVGPQADLFNLNVDQHSLGLVKNFQVTSEPSYVELTQGVRNSIVYSVLNANAVRASMEVYEFTAANLGYALGLNGGSFTRGTVASTLDVVASVADTSVTVAVGAGANFNVGDWIMIREGTTENVAVRKVTSVSGDTISFAEPLAKSIPAGSDIRVMNAIDVGSKEKQPFLSAKVLGVLPNGDEVILLLPKLRISKGFTLSFSTNDFGNLPFEFTVYDLVANDPNYATMEGQMAKLIVR